VSGGLDPSLITARRPVRLDGASVVGVLIVALYALPATLIVPGLTYAGRPALVLALGLFAWWVLARLSPRLVSPGPQPLRWAALALLASVLLSYVAGLLRGLPAVEANAQNFTVLVTLEILGLVLVTADGIRDLDRLRSVLRVFVWSAAFVAVVAFIQSTFAFDLSHFLVLPGLEFKADPRAPRPTTSSSAPSWRWPCRLPSTWPCSRPHPGAAVYIWRCRWVWSP